MTGRTNHPTLATQVTYGETQFRRRPQRFKQVHFNAIGRKHVGSDLGKSATVIPAVVRYSHFHVVAKTLLEVVGIALRGHTHGIFVHPVGADTHDPAKSARTKFQVFIKCIGQFIRLALLHTPDAGFGFFIKRAIQPLVYFILNCFIHIVIF